MTFVSKNRFSISLPIFYIAHHLQHAKLCVPMFKHWLQSAEIRGLRTTSSCGICAAETYQSGHIVHIFRMKNLGCVQFSCIYHKVHNSTKN